MIESSKKSKNPLVFKIAKILVIFLAVYAATTLLIRFVVPIVLNTFWGDDIAPIDDSSMQLSVINLSSVENSFSDLAKIKNVINLSNIPTDKRLAFDFISSDTWDDSKVEALLNDNELTFQYFSDAASKQKFQSPETADPNAMSHEVIEMNSWRRAAQLSCIKSIWLAKNGKGEEALETAVTVMAVGDLVEKSQANLITYLVGIALKKDALDTFQKVLAISNIDHETRLEYKNKLTAYSLSDNSSIWKFEYLNHKRTIQAIVSGVYNLSATSSYEYPTVKPSYYFKPNLSIKEDFNYFTNLIDRAKEPCSLEDKDLTKNEFSLTPKFKLYFTENALSKILLSTADLAYKGLLNNKCKIQQKYLKLISDF